MTPRNRYTPQERETLRSLKEHPGYALLMEGLKQERALAAKRLEAGGWEGVLLTRGQLIGIETAMDFVKDWGEEPKTRED